MTDPIYKFNGYTMRLIKIEDIEAYYRDGFEKPDQESNYFTGTTGTFDRDQIQAYVERIVGNDTRYDFIICSQAEIIGEVVLSDIKDGKGHYRIGIFKKVNFSKGIGYNATANILDFAFNILKLDSVDLEVFPFNERGIGLYEKLGFEVVDRIVDEEAEEPFRDIIVMALKKDFFK